jgi:DNA-binding transcriptional regulator YiaG
MTDEEIERSVAGDPDEAQVLDIKSWRRAKAKGKAFVRNPLNVATVRQKTGLSQDKFAQAIRISPHTLRGWEQGRRQPRGPARALLFALERDPRAVMMALRPDLAQEAAPLSAAKGGFGEARRPAFKRR